MANWAELIKGVQLSVRASVAAALSLVLAQLLELEYPIYALIAAIIVTDLSPAGTRQLAGRRVVATVLGATLGAVLCQVLPSEPWAVGLGILGAMLTSLVVGARDGARVAGYICGIVMLYHGDGPWDYALFRFAETTLGVAVAWTISLVPKLIRVDVPENPKT